MIPVGGFSHAVGSGETVMPWQGGTTKSLLEEQFRGDALLDTPVKLGKIFNACKIERIAGIRGLTTLLTI